MPFHDRIADPEYDHFQKIYSNHFKFQMNNEYDIEVRYNLTFLFLDLVYPAVHIQPGEEQKRQKSNGGESGEQPVEVINMGSV